MISVSTITANINCPVIMETDVLSPAESVTPRMTRTQTLDGGCVIVHNGFQDADRVMEFQADLPESDAVNLKNIVLTEAYLTLACADGFFTGVVENFEDNKGRVKFRFWIKERG